MLCTWFDSSLSTQDFQSWGWAYAGSQLSGVQKEHYYFNQYRISATMSAAFSLTYVPKRSEFCGLLQFKVEEASMAVAEA